MDNTVLLYQFAPSKISTSVGGANPIESSTDLHVKISRKSAVKPMVTSITIEIPTGAGQAAANRLSDANLPQPDCSLTDMAAWVIQVNGSALTIRPASNQPTALDHPIDLTFKGVLISPSSGFVPITVQECAPHQIQAVFPIFKLDPSASDVTPPSPDAGTPRLSLEYGFNSNPCPIRASGSGNDISTIDLVVTISRRPELAVSLKKTQITIPVANNEAYSLSSAGRLPQPRFDQSGLWDITVSTESNSDTVTIAPKSDASGQVTSTIEFTLPGIVVNQTIGFVPITIKETALDEITDGFTYRLEKFEPDFPVRRFYATPSVLSDLNETSTLHWESTDEGQNYSYRVRSADGGPDGRYDWIPKECLIGGDCYTNVDGGAGVQTPQLAETTSFALDVIKTDALGLRVIHKTLVIPVRVEVPYFSNAARVTQVAGQFAVLRWRAFNASRVTVRLNDDVIDRNAPADTYLGGYRVDLDRDEPHGRFHLTAHARVGTAVAYYASFPDVNMQKPTQLSDVTQAEVGGMGAPSVLAVAANKNVVLAIWGDGQWRVIDLEARRVPPVGNYDAQNFGGGWSSATITPDGKVALLVRFGISAFDLTSSTRAWGVQGDDNGVVVTQDGRLVLTTTDNQVRVTDMNNPTGASSFIQTGDWQAVTNLAVSYDGATAIVIKGGDLLVLDVAGRSVRGRVPISGYSVSQVALTPDGMLALATVYNNGGQHAVMLIDVPNQTVTDTIQLEDLVSPPVGMIAMGDSYAFILKRKRPDAVELELQGRGIFTDVNTIGVLDLTRKQIIATFDAGTGATAMAVRPDNSSIVVSNAKGILII